MIDARVRRPPSSAFTLPGILLLAFGLRLVLLDQRPIWYDEAFSVFLAEKLIPEIIRGTAADIQPPLYYIVLHFWQVIGEQVFTLRFLSVVFSLLSVALVYRLVQTLFSRRTGTFTALLTAVAPFQIQYAQELRMYALLEFLLLSCTLALVRLEKQNGGIRWVFAATAGAVAALYTQNLALLTLPVPILYAVLCRNRRLIRAVVASVGCALLLYVPWLAILISQVQSVQRSYWIAAPGVAELFQFILTSTTNLPLPDWMLPVAMFVTLSALVLAAIEMGRDGNQARRKGVGLVVSLAVVPLLLMFLVSYAVRSVFLVRGIIVSSLSLTMLLGWWIAQQRSARLSVVISLTMLGAMLPALYYQLTWDQFPRSPYAQAAAFLHDHVAADDVIVHDNKLTFFPMHYYDRSLEQVFIADPPEAGSNTLAPQTASVLGLVPTTVADATKGTGLVWLVIFERAINEAAAQGRTQGNLSYMDAHLTRLSVEHFNDLYVYVYKK